MCKNVDTNSTNKLGVSLVSCLCHKYAMLLVIVPVTDNVAVLNRSSTLSRRSLAIRMRHEGYEIGEFGHQDVVEIASHLLILL